MISFFKMSYQLLRNVNRRLTYNPELIEAIVLELADTYDVQVAWGSEALFMSDLLAVAGGLLGGFLGGKAGATFGVGIGAAAGIGLAEKKSLTEIWPEVKQKFDELIGIVYDFLRKLNTDDYESVINILMENVQRREELVNIIITFTTEKLGRKVYSNLNITQERDVQKSILDSLTLYK